MMLLALVQVGKNHPETHKVSLFLLCTCSEAPACYKDTAIMMKRFLAFTMVPLRYFRREGITESSPQ